MVLRAFGWGLRESTTGRCKQLGGGPRESGGGRARLAEGRSLDFNGTCALSLLVDRDELPSLSCDPGLCLSEEALDLISPSVDCSTSLSSRVGMKVLNTYKDISVVRITIKYILKFKTMNARSFFILISSHT